MEDLQIRFAVWGVGKRLKRYIDKINVRNIACFVDSDLSKTSELFYGKKVLSPKEISQWEFDYMVISSELFFHEIASQLVTELEIDVHKIINFETFMYINGADNAGIWNADMVNVFFDISASFHFSCFLDVGMYLNRMGYWHESEVCVDGCACGEHISSATNKPYGHIWEAVDAVKRHYDMAVVFEPDKRNILSLCQQTAKTADNVFVRISGELFWDMPWTGLFRPVIFRGYLFGLFQDAKEEGAIFEVSHKDFAALGDPLYQPLYVGGIKKTGGNILRDDRGDNISRYNPYINECTALYWIWKNTDDWIIGLNHYRRFFRSPINPYSPIQSWEMEQFLGKHDICVASPVGMPKAVKDVLYDDIDDRAFQAVFPKLKEIFQTIGGRDNEAFSYVMEGHMIFPCNMFLTTRPILNRYCEWLFPILFRLLEEVEIKEEWDYYSRRVIGYFAERLLTVWLIQQDYKIRELPVLFTDAGGAV